jgi:hypothetical protein
MKLHAVAVTLLGLALAGAAARPAAAKGTMPEDLLKGRIIISDQRLPMRWNSVSSYVGQLKSLNKGTIWYDKKTGKIKVEYAAFFAKALNDVQVNLIIYDITDGAHDRKATNEQFMTRGDRVLFNAITLDKEDFPMNKKYRFVIENRGQSLAQGEFILRGEGPHYSGKVEFSDDEAKQKD